MALLTTELRNKLERVIIDARLAAEAGAKAALEALAVHHYEPYPHMNAEARRLRNHLRARARQLGDRQDRSGRLEIIHLIHECGYQHWHRMLFARFLAENNLLIEPEMQVPISLEEAEELAREEGEDVWTFASRCAQRMLPQIFRPEDPLLRVDFAREHRLKLERLLGGLDAAVFTADDSLGWVYQFWQAQKKQEINAAGMKIGADELPPVTQLFTEDYMVLFLIHNTLGAWWAGKVLTTISAEELANADEASLRQACALPGVAWEYLRFIKDDNGNWRPAADTFNHWPQQAKDLRLLDPCMGSGHFLTAELPILVAMRMEEEGLSREESVNAVLENNLFGLELDPRCTQIAAFALALAAWKYPDEYNEPLGYRPLPPLNIACSGQSVTGQKEEWLALANGDDRLLEGMNRLYDLFRQAPLLGSLIDPRREVGDLIAADFTELQPLIEKALANEKVQQDADASAVGVAAQGIAKAAELLAGQYTLVATNVPYLGRGDQAKALRDWCERFYTSAKADLATVFVARIRNLIVQDGSLAVVTPQNWWFLSSYAPFRKMVLSEDSLSFAATLGEEAWQSFGKRGPKATLIITQNQKPLCSHCFVAVNAAPLPTIDAKIQALIHYPLPLLKQTEQYSNPDHRITIEGAVEGTLLEEYAASFQGIATADYPRFGRCFWELVLPARGWSYQQSRSSETAAYAGREHVLWWEDGRGVLAASPQARVQGLEAMGNRGVVVAQMRYLLASLYTGELFDNNVAAIIPKNRIHLPAIWAFCSSSDFAAKVRKVDSKVSVTNATFLKVPFDLDHWMAVATEKYPHSLPEPYSADPTQWLFTGHLASSAEPLQVAVAIMLDYRWPEQSKEDEAINLLADKDGIVCIPSIRGERPAADCFRDLLAAAFGDEWSPTLERKLIADTESSAMTLEDWLRNDFFEKHCRLFHHRPFIWHIWDGRGHDGFHALVNYHKLAAPNGEGRKLLENLTYSYLGDWIARQRDGVKRGEGGADDRLAAALELEKLLKAILDGEPPFDIFVRWKPLHQQPIGWEPDINDGVRVNIRPFMAADLPNGRTGAGILCWKPNINWGKDRGKEPYRPQEQSPWFWKDDTFTGDRINDVHLTNAKKRIARQKEDD